MQSVEEENPALGWRAIRIGLDRPGLLRAQIRALLKAAAGRPLKIMFPMVATCDEFERAKLIVEREKAHLANHSHPLPSDLKLGVMLESRPFCSSSRKSAKAPISSRSARTT